jgi:hypothetical protein
MGETAITFRFLTFFCSQFYTKCVRAHARTHTHTHTVKPEAVRSRNKCGASGALVPAAVHVGKKKLKIR